MGVWVPLDSEHDFAQGYIIKMLIGNRSGRARERGGGRTVHLMIGESNMPWWVDAAYVVGVVALFIVFDLIAKAVDRL